MPKNVKAIGNKRKGGVAPPAPRRAAKSHPQVGGGGASPPDEDAHLIQTAKCRKSRAYDRAKRIANKEKLPKEEVTRLAREAYAACV